MKRRPFVFSVYSIVDRKEALLHLDACQLWPGQAGLESAYRYVARGLTDWELVLRQQRRDAYRGGRPEEAGKLDTILQELSKKIEERDLGTLAIQGPSLAEVAARRKAVSGKIAVAAAIFGVAYRLAKHMDADFLREHLTTNRMIWLVRETTKHGKLEPSTIQKIWTEYRSASVVRACEEMVRAAITQAPTSDRHANIMLDHGVVRWLQSIQRIRSDFRTLRLSVGFTFTLGPEPILPGLWLGDNKIKLEVKALSENEIAALLRYGKRMPVNTGGRPRETG
ncbi:MAG: hypothetical protein RLY86_4129 [Pseudomonadota bacterium]|jgi:hypothetical protein